MFDRLERFTQRFHQTKRQPHHKNTYPRALRTIQSFELCRNAQSQEKVLRYEKCNYQNLKLVSQLTLEIR